MGLIQRQLKNNQEAMSAWIDADLAGDARASLELGKLMAWLAGQAGSNDAGAARPYLEKAVAAGIPEAQDLLDKFRQQSPGLGANRDPADASEAKR